MTDHRYHLPMVAAGLGAAAEHGLHGARTVCFVCGGELGLVVTVSRRLRDRFRRRYWVRCFECDLKDGPFVTVEAAHARRRYYESFPALGG